MSVKRTITKKIKKKQVLVRMWRKEIPCTLLVGMQIGVATMENSMEVPQMKNTGTPANEPNNHYLIIPIKSHIHLF